MVTFEPVIRDDELERVAAMVEWEVTLRRDIAEVERARIAYVSDAVRLQGIAAYYADDARTGRTLCHQATASETAVEANVCHARAVDCEAWLIRAKAALEPLGFLEFAS